MLNTPNLEFALSRYAVKGTHFRPGARKLALAYELGVGPEKKVVTLNSLVPIIAVLLASHAA